MGHKGHWVEENRVPAMLGGAGLSSHPSDLLPPSFQQVLTFLTAVQVEVSGGEGQPWKTHCRFCLLMVLHHVGLNIY